MTMSLIQTVTVGAGGAASISFTSIPQDGTDLFLVLSVRSARASFIEEPQIRVNGLSTSIYSRINLQGSGSSVSTNNLANQTVLYGLLATGSTATANTFGNSVAYFSNYTSSSNKSVSIDSTMERNATESYLSVNAGIIASTAAITSIEITSINASNFVQYSSASLYKITKGSDGTTVVS